MERKGREVTKRFHILCGAPEALIRQEYFERPYISCLNKIFMLIERFSLDSQFKNVEKGFHILCGAAEALIRQECFQKYGAIYYRYGHLLTHHICCGNDVGRIGRNMQLKYIIGVYYIYCIYAAMRVIAI